MAKLVSLREFARIRGVSLKAVQKAIESGRITVEKENGLKGIDPDKANDDWDSSTDPAKQTTATRNGGHGPEAAPQTVASRVYADSRAAKESFAAKMAKLEYELRAGSLAEVSKVNLAAFQAGRIVRDYLSGMSARIAGKLAAETDPVKVQIILDAEINRALIELARQGREKTGVTPEAEPDVS